MIWRPLGEHFDWEVFQRAADDAAAKVVVAKAVESADHFFHTLFVSGDEPKWTHPSQREACLKHAESILALAKLIGVIR